MGAHLLQAGVDRKTIIGPAAAALPFNPEDGTGASVETRLGRLAVTP